MHRAPGGIGLPGQTRSALPCRVAGETERLAWACADEAPTAPELWLPAAVPWLGLLPWLPPLLPPWPPPLPWPPPPCPPRASAFMLANAKMQISGPNVTRFRIRLLARSAYHLADSFAKRRFGGPHGERFAQPAQALLRTAGVLVRSTVATDARAARTRA